LPTFPLRVKESGPAVAGDPDALLDADGAAVVIHAHADDQRDAAVG